MPLHDVSSIETPEQIEVHLPLAGVGSRGWAFIIDLLWQMVPIIAAMIALVTAMPNDGSLVEVEQGRPTLTLAFQAILSLVIFFINFGYFAFFETIWQGQTPGKRKVGLRVVRDGGHPLDGRSALLRNFLRIVDFLPSSYLLGMGFVFVGRQGKRIGDYAAGTLVIHDTRAPTAIPTAQQAQGPLTHEQRALLNSYLERRHLLDEAARVRVAAALVARLAPAVGRDAPSAEQADTFLLDLGDTLRAPEDAPHGRR